MNDLKTTQLIDYTLRLNACVWAVWTAFLALFILQFPENGAVQALGITGTMVCLGVLTKFLWSVKSTAVMNLRSKLWRDFLAHRMARSNFLAAVLKVMCFMALVLTSYVLTVSSGFLLAVSFQCAGDFRKGEEIYRASSGYKSLLEDRPITALWIRHKPSDLAKLEAITKAVYGVESKEVGHFYRACADADNLSSDRQKNLNEALRIFKQANLATESTECMAILVNMEQNFYRMPQAYAEVYPLVIQHPSIVSCGYLKHMATYLKRPQSDVDSLNAAKQNLSERNAPMRFIGDGVFYLLFAFPLVAATSVVAYRVSLPFLGWAWTRQLKGSLSHKKKIGILNKLITVQLLRSKLESADKRSREFSEMVESL